MTAENTESLINFVRTQLNGPQQAAVIPLTGIFLVRAGAGSGKTRVITTRIAQLIAIYQVPPYTIVALTFTNKAAREMKERVERFVGNQLGLFVGTFHAYCLLLLKKYGSLLNIITFTLLDDEDQDHLITGIIKKHGFDKYITLKAVKSYFAVVKNGSAVDQGYSYRTSMLEQIYGLYKEEKQKLHCYDFDDLLLVIVHALKTNQEFRAKIQNTIKHLLVDEYQDTNSIQHELLTLLAYDTQKTLTLTSLCAVGDEDQSIYSWRGALVANLQKFTHDFPTVMHVTIDQNYRSAQSILTSANMLIKNNNNRVSKNLWSNYQIDNAAAVAGCSTGYSEGLLAIEYAQQVKKINAQASIACLYRSHYQSRVLEEALIINQIPYKIIGGVQFYARQEIKDILAYLRLMVNPFDRVAFARVINRPKRTLGKQFLEDFMVTWDQTPEKSFIQIINDSITQNLFRPSAQRALQQFISFFNLDHDEYKTPDLIIKKIIDTTKYYDFLRDEHEEEDANSRIENLKELINACTTMVKEGVENVRDFLERVSLFETERKSATGEGEPVYLMTIHAAKGLEFDAVVICALEENIFPSARTIFEQELLEEERRLLYVGITRARRALLLLHAYERLLYGQHMMNRRSRFLDEIETVCTRLDFSGLDDQEIKQKLRIWLSGILKS
jgi:DNA helicase-2/ATP-dependent DNA helicase PcrA